MKKHKYLDVHKNAKNASVMLSVLMTVFLVLGALLIKGDHNTLADILFAAGAFFAVMLAAFIIHYIRHNNYDDIKVKQKVGILHFYSLHTILTAAVLFAGKIGSFPFGVIHAINDGLFVGFAVMILAALFSKRGCVAAIILSLIAAVLSYLYARSAHMYLHLGAILIMGLVFCCFVFTLLPKESYKLYKSNDKDTDKDGISLKESSSQNNIHSEKGDKDAADKIIVKQYQDLSAYELLSAPVDALYGVSEGDAELLKRAFGIKTIGDLADNKFFKWAEEITEEAKK